MATLSANWRERLLDQQSERVIAGRNRYIRLPEGLDFCSNDYLGLRNDVRLAEAAIEALNKYGTGSGGARLLRGTSPLHEELEDVLADWKGAESCLLLNSGYQANASLIPALVGQGDAVFSDSLNHASLIDGCRMAKIYGAEVFVYKHLNLDHLREQLTAWREKRAGKSAALIVTDAIFSMDGDLADLPGLTALCSEFEALLFVDEAHATGLIGPTGAGLAELQDQDVHGSVPVVMGTLGKALGGFGAFVCGSSLLIEHLINTCRGFIFSTALPAHVAAVALKAIQISQAEPWRRQKALENAATIRRSLGQENHMSAIVPVLIGSDDSAVQQATRLQKHGFDIRAVRPPTVPEGTARLRITTNALQREEDVLRLTQLL